MTASVCRIREDADSSSHEGGQPPSEGIGAHRRSVITSSAVVIDGGGQDRISRTSRSTAGNAVEG